MALKDLDRRFDQRAEGEKEIQAEILLPPPRVRDISVSGLYLLDSRAFSRGQTIELRLRIGSQPPMEVSGMIRRVDPGIGIAVEFTHITPQDRRRLRDFVAAHPQKREAPVEDKS